MSLADSTHRSSVKLGLDALLEEICRLRSRLNEMSLEVGNLSNPSIVEISQQLDQKLNAYEQMKNKQAC
ncbi:hypothetical protein BEP19_14530 [Ammoniphilus oxalaticus]|uniref:Sporulation protein Spo0E n=1 Tax=Ammoniphilus oxalaticus TaxID=66863 RepID=A0A419SES0_9BACL|nr:aspartyl-phosphate phosphatase Spo0E family protein [Ammoniphilus oxalaticus]RKD21825.1 hypothetical protein BEP19_14530 [Ammoniphilus oxalaticus]